MNGKRAPHHVALIDGLATQRVQLRRRLEHAGCAPVLFEDSSELLALLCTGRRFDLLLIVEDGASTWRQLVTVCGVFGIPTLVLAGKPGFGQAHTWVHDFPVSPLFDFTFLNCHEIELRQRILKLLHHGAEFHEQLVKAKGLVFGNYKFQEGLCVVAHRGREIGMQPRQFRLALELFRNIGRVMERQQLWASVWGESFPPKNGRSLDVCVTNVRKKLDICPQNGFTLNSVYRRGYQLLAVPPGALSTPDLAKAAPLPVASLATSFQPSAG